MHQESSKYHTILEAIIVDSETRASRNCSKKTFHILKPSCEHTWHVGVAQPDMDETMDVSLFVSHELTLACTIDNETFHYQTKLCWKAKVFLDMPISGNTFSALSNGSPGKCINLCRNSSLQLDTVARAGQAEGSKRSNPSRFGCICFHSFQK
jgi:hypothetical protein